ncbi:nucleotide-binding protein YvcJ [Alicyclobacillus contaminans]|uniref:RNase adapter RapZ n=1 Tax=Alicyclobacillus contaminans TaxID=392016 RepID=UPI00041B826B|nr:RNase adapter RapZ [Alicyclobacillus contaminans]GMA50255.1 nucleotide-binding protein YvcJ [Alicyclobacillus contaminans]
MADKMEVLIITGMSGAGKTVAMQSLEDIGYFCVDNLPPALIPKFVDVAKQSGGKLAKVALACDLRGGDLFQPLVDTVRQLRNHPGVQVTVLFLEANDETLVRRFKETRRRHPFVDGARLLDGIQGERLALAQVRAEADILLDTSDWRPGRLKQELVQRFAATSTRFPVHIISFGFKYGIPIDADMILDVRFLPNPHYVESLRPFTGEDAPVYDYVMQWPATQEFLRRAEDLVDFLIPQFTKEGKTHLVIGIGCTGGKHRSVAVSRHLHEHIKDRTDASLTHRDSRREG